MNAWSLAMKDESKRHLDDNTADSNDTLVQLLVERVDQLEAKAERSEAEIKELKRRLTITEKRISPVDNNHIPWRRIGTEENSVDRCEEGELSVRNFRPEEEYQLPKDVYSIVASWKICTRPFVISMLVISMQIALLVLLLVDQTEVDGGSDLFKFPTNVPSIVHAAQALATVIAIMDQDDLRSAIEQFFDGPPTRFKGDPAFQQMTKAQWNFSCFFRFFQGFLSVMSAFVLAVQSTTVFDVLLNFLGVKFVSELDDLAFTLSLLGYFGDKSQRASKCIAEAQFQQDDRNKVDQSSWNLSWFYKYAHVIGVFCILACLIAFFVVVVVSQETGNLAVQIVKLEFVETSVPFGAVFRDCYEVDLSGRTYSRRRPYVQMSFPETGGMFGFCDDIAGEKAWTFSFASDDPCTQWFGRSEATTTFDILEVGDNTQWFSNDGLLLGNIKISPVLNAASECGISTIDDTKELCDQLNVEFPLGIIAEEVSQSKSFYKTFVTDAEPNVFNYQALMNPIYVGESSTPQNFDMIFFTGQSWVLAEIVQRKEATGNNVSIQEYIQNDPEFISILDSTIYHGYNVLLVTDSVIDTANSHTPLGLRWFRMRERDPRLDSNYPTADESRPVELEVFCAACNNITNPCNFDGVCRADQTCACVNGGFGALCSQAPLGDSICDPYFNTEQFGWDGGDCCGGSCNGAECGFGSLSFPFGIDSKAQGIDELNILGYGVCEDPKMAPVTIELKDFETLDDEEWNAIAGNLDSDPICSTATVNVRCDGTTYLHVPQHILPNPSCSRSFTETIHVPFGSRCEISTNMACLGITCLDHSISVYYGNGTTSEPIRSGRVRTDAQVSFGIPSKCLTKVLSGRNFSIFDLSTDQGRAANALSNDDLSEFLCGDSRVESGLILDRFALSVFNHSVHFNSSNWKPYQCHGFGIPAFNSQCSMSSITSLILEVGAVTKVGTIPSEISLLTGLTTLVLRGNTFTGTIPTELGVLTELNTVELWSNNLSGTIPSEIGSLTKLTALALANNRITGTIPVEILRLSLTGFWVDVNMINGTVPSEFGRMPLVALSLNSNLFSGTLPSELFNIPSLSSLGLSFNRLTGSIPEIGSNLNLKTLVLENNFMTGSLPQDIGRLPWVELNLSNNSFSGEIPPLPEMQICALDNNNFVGQVQERCLA